MGKKRFTNWNNSERVINQTHYCSISQEVNGQLFFEIGNEVTTDVAEAVAILMTKKSIDQQIWETQFEVKAEEIEPKKAIYWLTGGDREWITLNHYKHAWSEIYLDFQEKFGHTIVDVIKNSRTLAEVRNGFTKLVNLPILYDFALSTGFVR